MKNAEIDTGSKHLFKISITFFFIIGTVFRKIEEEIHYLMKRITASLHTKVHKWMDAVGFRSNGSQTDIKDNVTTHHYFFETFNFFEKLKNNDTKNSRFLCFDAYGESFPVKTLLDLQTAFFENISQLK